MNIEAMNQLIRVLTNVQNTPELAIAFNLDDWMSTYTKEDYNELTEKYGGDFADDSKRIMIPHKCGATACAVGYAGLDPWFRARGLSTSIDGDVKYVLPGENEDDDGAYDGFDAAAEFFGISADNAFYLFSDVSYADRSATGPDQVITRIKQMIEDDLTKQAEIKEQLQELFKAPTGDA